MLPKHALFLYANLVRTQVSGNKLAETEGYRSGNGEIESGRVV